MTSNEFVIWLREFIQASSTLTPKQFDDVKEQLDKVKEDPVKWTRYTLDNTNWNINTTNKINND